MARPQAFELPLLDSLRNSSWLHVFFSLRKLIVNMDQPKHSYSARECPICKGMCKLVQFNSLAPGEEIQKAIEDRKRLIDKLRDLDDQLRHKGTSSKFRDPVRGQATPLHSPRRRLPGVGYWTSLENHCSVRAGQVSRGTRAASYIFPRPSKWLLNYNNRDPRT